jgi:hypothetical protein
MRAILAAMILGVSLSEALAGRPLTDEERVKLTAAMAAEGCSGGTMEFDDGKFEVDEAVCADGKEYDLAFDAAFRLIKKKLED